MISPRFSGVASRFGVDASAPLSALGALAVGASLFFPWLTLRLSACVFSLCGSTKSAHFSIIQISTASGLISLLGGPLAMLLPVVGSYGQLALWCVGAAGYGLFFAGYRLRQSRSAARLSSKGTLNVVIALVWSGGQLFLIGGTTLQMYQTLQLQNTASVSILNISPGSYTQPGPLLLLGGLALLGVAALLGLRASKGRRHVLAG